MSWSEYYPEVESVNRYLGNLFTHREFLDEIVKLHPKRVLEVGAGPAGMSVLLSQLGIEVVSLDNDPAVLKVAEATRQRFGGRNELKFGDAFQLPFADNSFDLVFHQGLLEHFSNEDVHRLLDEQLRVAPVVLASMPNSRYPRLDFGNERLMNRSQWEQVLAPKPVALSRDYSKKFLPRWYILRAPIHYMVKVTR